MNSLLQSHWRKQVLTSSPLYQSRNRRKGVKVTRWVDLGLGPQIPGPLTHMYASLSEGHAKLQGSCMVEEERRVIWSLGGGWLGGKGGCTVCAGGYARCGWQSAGRVPGSRLRSSEQPGCGKGHNVTLVLGTEAFKTPMKGTSEKRVQSQAAGDIPASVL